MAYKLKNTCKKCNKEYLVSEVQKNYGSDRDECWPCLKQWMLDAANDPYRMGAAIMRCELPQHISEQGAALFKQAFETAFQMLYPNRSVLDEMMEELKKLPGVEPAKELSPELVAALCSNKDDDEAPCKWGGCNGTVDPYNNHCRVCSSLHRI